MSKNKNKIRDPYYLAERIADEYVEAKKQFDAFNSYHEGFAVLKEELDELWDEIKSKNPNRHQNIQNEALQVGAMALAFLVEFDYELEDS